VHEDHNNIKPGNYKDASSFFVTSEMIENPSDKLFRGKHAFIGEMLAVFTSRRTVMIIGNHLGKIQAPELLKVIFGCEQRDQYAGVNYLKYDFLESSNMWISPSPLGALPYFVGTFVCTTVHRLTQFTVDQTSDKKPNFIVHSYDFHDTGSPFRVGIKCKIKDSSLLGTDQPSPALCVYTTLPHSNTTYRLLYSGIVNATRTLEPDFIPFALRTADLAMTKSEDSGAGSALDASPVILVLRDVDGHRKPMFEHEVGSEIGYVRMSVRDIFAPLRVTSGKTQAESAPSIDFFRKPPLKLQKFESDRNGVTTLLTTDTQHVMTYVSVLRDEVKTDLCKVGNSIFWDAAKTHRTNVIRMLSEVAQKCTNTECPFFNGAGLCLNLESQGLHDQDLQEIMM
jgi:hypothetical protein